MPGVLLLHAWWGLNDDVRAYAKRLRDAGFSVTMPDLYNGKVADTIPGAEALRDALERDATTINNARAKVDEAASQVETPFAIVGFSLGAFYAWDLVKRRPGAATALVVYYGTAGEPPEQAPPVLGHFAAEDEFEPADVVAKVEAALRAKDVAVTHHTYPGTRHWFAEPTRPEYDARAAELAFERTLEFLRRTLH